MCALLLLALADLTVSDYVALAGGLLTLLTLASAGAAWCSAMYREVHSIAGSLAKITEAVADHERRLAKAHL
jgi:hypothetical protein